MAMPQCCYLAKGAKRPSHTTNTIKFDRIQFDPCNSIKRFDLCPFNQKNSTYLQPPPQMHGLFPFNKLNFGLYDFAIWNYVSLNQRNECYELRNNSLNLFITDPTRLNCTSAFFFNRLSKLVNFLYLRFNLKILYHPKATKAELEKVFGKYYLTSYEDSGCKMFLNRTCY